MTELPRVAMRKVLSGPHGGMVVVDSTLDHFLQNDGDPDALFQQSGSLLKSSSSTRSALVNPDHLSGDVGSKVLYVKEFRYKGVVHSLKHLFGKHRAQVMWKVSWHLLNHSIPVPEPEGYLLRKSGPFCRDGYFFSKVLSGCNSLATLARTSGELGKMFASGDLIEILAREIASLHDCRVTHGDLKWSNILIDEKNDKLWFVDLDSAKLHTRFCGPAKVARDLARFVLYGFQTETNKAVMNRFLEEYCRHRSLAWESIEDRTAKVLKKLRKRHKSVSEERIKEVLKNY
jgi:serine/threonine protein kinase